ncbi:phage baseplate assembly protein V [Micromonospora soli]|uniref:phage baseplate assembly protein V n=1 Tax=Micromonospora sp. NBRC 110009 TaxID=3061627 RepID=UPI002674063E|nr:phage baseplate assembly protein V [Micromonospora sp. NBRC 110009]WKT96875.1 phage baseplate assembly protein V [Micromonospora sp. NBRC 110009]
MGLPAPADGSTPGYYGIYPAIVTDLVDDDKLGRVEVRFPWLGSDGDRDVRAWATLCSPYADDSQGLLVLPEVGTQVMVAFEAGNLRRPYVLGATWNGRESLPHDPETANNIRLFRSRTDSRLEFDDSAGAAKLSITMASGHEVTLDDSGQTVTVKHSAGCTVRLTATAVEIQGNVSVDVTAPMVKVDAPIATFSGLVKVGTLIAEQMVMSPAYTPGAGNIW